MRYILVIVAITLTLGNVVGSPASQALKMRIALTPLDWEEAAGNVEIPRELWPTIDAKLVTKLLETRLFVVLERESLDELQQEQILTGSTQAQNQDGRILPAQALVKCKVIQMDVQEVGRGKRFLRRLGSLAGKMTMAKVGINVRIFTVDTAELLASEMAFGQPKSASYGFLGTSGGSVESFEQSPLGKAFTEAIDDAVDKIQEKLGAVSWEASIADWDAENAEVYINAGEDLGVQVGTPFHVYRLSRIIKDPETGEILGKRRRKVGSVEVIDVQKKFSIAKVIAGKEFEIGDAVREAR